jgi:hypothetical protein
VRKIYFFGEYGYAFRQFLPFLEKTSSCFIIATWEPICLIINLLWPKHETHSEKDFDLNVNGLLRSCNNYHDLDFIIKLEKLGYVSCKSFNVENEKIFVDDAHKVFGILKRKITYGEQKQDKPYVSIFPRARGCTKHKNNVTQDHIDWLVAKYPNKEVVGHGLPEERFCFNIRYCNNILEQIHVFNNSEIFICPDSGLADLALMCGCDLLLTGGYDGIQETNPHGCSIKYWSSVDKIVL